MKGCEGNGWRERWVSGGIDLGVWDLGDSDVITSRHIYASEASTNDNDNDNDNDNFINKRNKRA